MNQIPIEMNTMRIAPIGVIHTPFKQKFTVPRQPRLLKLAKGEIHLLSPFNQIEAVQELKQFSHIHVLFWFHLNPAKKSVSSEHYQWQPMVRPPRLGGKEKVGVFATRSPFRPNPIGLSVLNLDRIEQKGKLVIIHVSGVDLVDGTPIIDIKPYIPFSDSIVNANGGFASAAPEAQFNVLFSDNASLQLVHHAETEGHNVDELKEFIIEVLAQDPRPSYHLNKKEVREYGVELLDMNLKWLLDSEQKLVTVTAIESTV